jgi:bacteriorhodopsin
MKVCFYIWGCIGLFLTTINMMLLVGVPTSSIMQQTYVAVFFLLSFIAGLLFFGLGMIGTRSESPKATDQEQPPTTA